MGRLAAISRKLSEPDSVTSYFLPAKQGESVCRDSEARADEGSATAVRETWDHRQISATVRGSTDTAKR